MHHKSTNFHLKRGHNFRDSTYNTIPYRRRPCVRICRSLYSGWWRHMWWVGRLLCRGFPGWRPHWWVLLCGVNIWCGCRGDWCRNWGVFSVTVFALRRGRKRRKGSQARFPEISSCFCCQVARAVMESITYESTLVTDIIVLKLMNSRWLQMLRHHVKCFLLVFAFHITFQIVPW